MVSLMMFLSSVLSLSCRTMTTCKFQHILCLTVRICHILYHLEGLSVYFIININLVPENIDICFVKLQNNQCKSTKMLQFVSLCDL